ncbi:MAG TPA: hypothetical protein VF188_10830 [Longimicrobiales bacterium]
MSGPERREACVPDAGDGVRAGITRRPGTGADAADAGGGTDVGPGTGIDRGAGVGATGAAPHRRWLDAALALDAWMRGRDYAGYDPHDLLSSPLVRRLCLGSRWLGVAWTQFGKRSPLQVRPLLGVRPVRNAKGVGLVLGAHLRLARVTGEAGFYESARGLMAWLGANGATVAGGIGWGYPFPWANRDAYVPAGTPSAVATAFVGHALLDASAALGSAEAAALAARAGTFLRRGLNRIPGGDGTFCFSYTPVDRRAVHNASLLAASLLARLAAAGGAAAGELADDAMRAARFTVRAQRPDGAWPYGVGARNGWVDSFHTGYILVALRDIADALETTEFDDALERGIAYWRRAFFDGPAVGFHPGRPYPVDVHAVAHAILALLALRDRVPDGERAAGRLADWCIDEMRDAAGFFYHLRTRRRVNRLPYMRWVQAWMLRALSELAATGVPVASGGGVPARTTGPAGDPARPARPA